MVTQHPIGVRHPLGRDLHRPTTGIQLASELTLGELTNAVVKYTINNKIPMPVGFKIRPWGWDADEDPPPGLPIGPCNFFVISV